MTIATVLAFGVPVLAQEISAEARRHMIRGEAAMEMAESIADKNKIQGWINRLK